MRVDFLIDESSDEYFFCETSSYPFCARERMYPPNVDEYLFDFWKNCFPFNINTIEEIIDKTKTYVKNEKC